MLLTSASRNGNRIGRSSPVGEPMPVMLHGSGRLSHGGVIRRLDILSERIIYHTIFTLLKSVPYCPHKWAHQSTTFNMLPLKSIGTGESFLSFFWLSLWVLLLEIVLEYSEKHDMLIWQNNGNIHWTGGTCFGTSNVVQFSLFLLSEGKFLCSSVSCLTQKLYNPIVCYCSNKQEKFFMHTLLIP